MATQVNISSSDSKKPRPSSSSSAAAAAAAPLSWADLPYLPLLLILDNLFSIPDIFAFSAVCRPWRSLAKSGINSASSRPPLLLRPSLPSPLRPRPSSLHFLDPAGGVAGAGGRSLRSPIPSQTLGLGFLGYSQGLLLFSSETHAILADPFSGSALLLRNPPSGPLRGLSALSAPISDPNSFLLNLAQGGDDRLLLSCHLSTGRWAYQDFPPAAGVGLLMPFSGKVYGLTDEDCHLVVLEFSGAGSVLRWSELEMQLEGAAEVPHRHLLYSHCLVGCGGDLLMVLFTIQEETFVRVEIYRMDSRRAMWLRVDKLEGWCLFLDPYMRVGMACHKPERWGGSGNCVYVVGFEEETPWVELKLDGTLIDGQGGGSPLAVDYLYRMLWSSPLWVYPGWLC